MKKTIASRKTLQNMSLAAHYSNLVREKTDHVPDGGKMFVTGDCTVYCDEVCTVEIPSASLSFKHYMGFTDCACLISALHTSHLSHVKPFVAMF
ncbi:uncharacterized protein PHALS_15028 [Plasmopara halstedii]|uniref:Uncharacterized protein n=1 Tax=Plasmopara halstedii TaxID=4781 RepID=A0A0P1A8W6_PLAHL|nr:uncharacterized protein PHALS_15028 [Plasmopara halstedii]CEG37142.1 hypothetical protein PHALS_15028 [Plasmopara halstedii]|eukprot:XP_024573511.1 hypothetical protein PHALS_15028 [Plasmopara halstedii]